MKKIIIQIFVTFLLIIFLTFVFSELYSRFKNRGEIEDSSYISNSIPKDYSQLLKFKDSCCGKLNENIVFFKTTMSKFRNPVSDFYVADKYYSKAYKMDTSFKYSLKETIKRSFSDAHTSTYTPYSVDNTTDLEFLFKNTKPHKPKNIYFILYANNIRVLKNNDTVVYYHCECRNFSIKFNPQDQNDIYGECTNQTYVEVPLEIMFLKKRNNLYTLTLSSKDAHTDLNKGMLNSLLLN